MVRRRKSRGGVRSVRRRGRGFGSLLSLIKPLARFGRKVAKSAGKHMLKGNIPIPQFKTAKYDKAADEAQFEGEGRRRRRRSKKHKRVFSFKF